MTQITYIFHDLKYKSKLLMHLMECRICRIQYISGLYPNFNNFISEEYKVGLIFTLLFGTFSTVSNLSRFYSEVCHLKEILKKNAFPMKLIDSCIKNFLSKRLAEKPVTLTDKKKDLVIVLQFLGKLSLD